MCSSNLSDTANRLRKTRKKKSSAVPPFRSGHISVICARLSKGKGRKSEGGNRRCLPSCAPARRQRRCLPSCAPARQARFRSLHKRHSAVLHQNAKKEEHCCLAVSLFAHITGFCFPDLSAVPHGGALLRSQEALSPALQRTRVSPGRCAYARDSRSYPRTGRAFSADD